MTTFQTSDIRCQISETIIHFAILKATHNPFVVRIGKTILQLFKSSISTSMLTIPEIALWDHKRIFDAFIRKDEDKLVEAVVASFEGWKKSLEKMN